MHPCFHSPFSLENSNISIWFSENIKRDIIVCIIAFACFLILYVLEETYVLGLDLKIITLFIFILKEFDYIKVML